MKSTKSYPKCAAAPLKRVRIGNGCPTQEAEERAMRGEVVLLAA
jgi:hypothetical protein